MKILHFCPKARQIRFFRNIKTQLNENFSDHPDVLINHWKVREFLKVLGERTSQLDAVIISAHGWGDSILKPVSGGTFEKAIKLDDAYLFRNKFVFANSCYTAKEFGPALVANGAFTYVGFNDSISNAFLSDNQYRESIEKIFKGIYTKSLSEAFTSFVKQCLTANEFCERIDFRFRKNLSEVSKMSLSEINSNFQVNIKEDNSKVMQLMKLEFVQKFNDLKGKITLIGEENYVYWDSIKNLSNEQLTDRLAKVEGISEKNNLYKCFIKILIYTCLDEKERCLEEVERFQIELEGGNKEVQVFTPPINMQQEFMEIKRSYAG
ncbi:hypothetical protein ACWKT9_00130 [Bacillus wiedmannii]